MLYATSASRVVRSVMACAQTRETAVRLLCTAESATTYWIQEARTRLYEQQRPLRQIMWLLFMGSERPPHDPGEAVPHE